MDAFDYIEQWERKHARYFLREGKGRWKTVTEAEFIAAERQAGFWPKAGCGPIATAGFEINGPDGSIPFRIVAGGAVSESVTEGRQQ